MARPCIQSQALTLALAALMLAMAAFRPPAEPDEARYAEAAREMIETGDYLVPRQSGHPYPNKPPLLYWAMLPFLALLGSNAFAARIPALLAWAGILLLLRRRLRTHPERGHIAVLLWAVMPMPFLLGQLATFDMLLTFFTTAAIFILLRLGPSASRALPWLGGVALGAAFLTKGPVGWLVPLSVAACSRALMRQPLRPLLDPRLWLPACLLALPWYGWMLATQPALADFWFGEELVGRVASDVHRRAQPFWFFPALALLTTFPWWLPLLKSGARRSLLQEGGVDEVVWSLLPVLFFSLPSGKQPAYLLPAIPGFALLFSRLWSASPYRRFLPPLAAGWLVLYLGATSWAFQEPTRLRSQAPIASAIRNAGGSDWEAALALDGSYGLPFLLERSDILPLDRPIAAWRYATSAGLIPNPYSPLAPLESVHLFLDHDEPRWVLIRRLEAWHGRLEQLVTTSPPAWSVWYQDERHLVLANRSPVLAAPPDD